jgi:hypothetical protein
MDWLKEILKKAGIEEGKLDSVIGDINKELPKALHPEGQVQRSGRGKEEA